jgi:hypothetical protein
MLLSPNQEWTYDAFSFCAEGKASLSVLKPNGSFSFEAIDALTARALMRCMSEYGFSFDSPRGESTNVAREGDLAEPFIRATLSSRMNGHSH